MSREPSSRKSGLVERPAALPFPQADVSGEVGPPRSEDMKGPTFPLAAFNPFRPAQDYVVDFWQRSLLFADIMRERGNQYFAHLAEKVPNVLAFDAELVLSGLTLKRPVNYGLVRIIPPPGVAISPRKRPFVVVDPRAGHGPGIGGFKPESEIGMALAEGHPCYFVGFLPNPVPGQTIEDVLEAQACFLEQVIALHPECSCQPAVIGNCQAGWQVLMTAAIRPELFGPIILAGAPLSYWAGWPGKNPMRYAGGLLGGSWLTALTSDLGNGRFDGANLVQNFENLDPANTLWTKQYNVFSKVDTEAQRYLDFERYWGGHVFLTDVEMQYIVDNLFIGNKLSTAELVTSDGVRIDLRNIRSPILCFCSYGDNITPPPQALGWITDLYVDDEDVRAHDQRIIYSVHDSIGHLGIFVSGRVGRKEHREFTTNIDFLDSLPSGIYQAELHEKGPQTRHSDLAYGEYLLSLEARGLDDVRRIVSPDVESDRRFAAVARVSQVNVSLYRTFVQPWVREVVMQLSAQWLERLHPLRLSYELISDRNPWMAWVPAAAQQQRENRRPVPADNPFLQAQEMFSQAVVACLDQWRLWRDGAYELAFEAVYGSPLLQAWVGMNATGRRQPRDHPGETPEHLAFVRAEAERLRGAMAEGGLAEASARALYYICRVRSRVDERTFNLIRRMRDESSLNLDCVSLAKFKQAIRDQMRILRLDEAGAIAALPGLLSRARAAEIDHARAAIERIVNAEAPPDEITRLRLEQVLAVFEEAGRHAEDKGGRGHAAA